MRKLASIQRIDWIRPIEGKDRIELAGVLGWQVIVEKDEFDVGDLCVYVEIDSKMPEKPEFEFLRPKKFRIRTMKLGGVLSEGICFPLTMLPVRMEPYMIDEDVTEVMGITKYEPMEEENWWKELKPEAAQLPWYKKTKLMKFGWYRKLVGGTKGAKGGFPDFISKTDETRIQNCPWVLNDDNHFWVATEKIDGTSGTFALVRHKRFILPDKFEYIVCSRNMRLQKDNSIYWQVSEKYEIEKALKNLIGKSDWVAIQGECIGPKIQKNKYKRTEPELYVFNLLYPDGRRPSTFAKGLLETRGLDFVPIVDEKFALPETVEKMLELAHGESALGNTLREGLVVRSQDGRKSFKAVDPEFLIYYGI